MAAKKTPIKIKKPTPTVRLPPPSSSPDVPLEAKAAFVGAETAAGAPAAPAPSKIRAALKSSDDKRRINMLLPSDLVKRLRHFCADHDKIDMTKATTEALEAYLAAAKY